MDNSSFFFSKILPETNVAIYQLQICYFFALSFTATPDKFSVFNFEVVP
jgi:hypothetical protein